MWMGLCYHTIVLTSIAVEKKAKKLGSLQYLSLNFFGKILIVVNENVCLINQKKLPLVKSGAIHPDSFL